MKTVQKQKEVCLQSCSEKDIPELMKVARQSYEEHYMYLWTNLHYAHWYMNLSFSAESLQKQIAGAHTQFFLVQYANTFVGFVKLNLDKALFGDAPDKSVELERIYLLNKVSGKGVGTRVMQQIIALAKEKDKDIIWLKSMDSSRSVQFYKKNNFQIVSTERLPFEGFKDEYRGMVVMRLVIE